MVGSAIASMSSPDTKMKYYLSVAVVIWTLLLPIIATAQMPLPSFPDYQLQACFEEQVTENNWQYAEDVTSLVCVDRNIQNIDGIDQLPNLATLDLGHNQIESLNGLGVVKLQALTTLRLENNQIVDVSPLQQYTQFKELWLSGNQYIDFQQLRPIIDQNHSLSVLGVGDINFRTSWFPVSLDPILMTKLDVSNTGIREIPDYRNLVYLDASDNRIDNLLFLTRVDPLSLKEIYLGNNRIVDVEPLQQFTQLKVLWLSGNRDIDFQQLKPIIDQNHSLQSLGVGDIKFGQPWLPEFNIDLLSLTRLDVSNTGIAMVPNYENLVYLDASDNQIEDLYPLNSINPQALTSLFLGNNRIVDVTPLQQFNNLEVLWLSGNPDVNQSQLNSVISQNFSHLRELGVGGLQGYRPSVDPWVITKLDVSNTGLSMAPDYENLVYLDASDNQIEDLYPLNHINSQALTSLYLGNNRIVDVMPLQEFNNLEVLWLSGNPDVNQSQLNSVISQNFSHLRELGVGGLQGYRPSVNPWMITKLDVSNTGLSMVPDYENLVYLDASDNQIDNLYPLNSIDPQTLTSLYLSNNRIVDVVPLQKFNNLEALWLSGNPDVNQSQLNSVISQNFSHLRELGVGGLQGYRPSVNPWVITKLDVSNTGLSMVPDYENLVYLDASNNQIDNLYPLNAIDPQTLTSLYLGNNRIVDVTPLQQFTQLEALWLSGNRDIDQRQLDQVINQNRATLRELGVGDLQGYVPMVDPWVITKLDVSNTGLSMVPDYENLVYLDASDNQIENLYPLNYINPQTLTSLYLSNNRIVDVVPLQKFNNLEALWLSGNPDVNQSQLDSVISQNFSHLRELGVGGLQGYRPSVNPSVITQLDVSSTGLSEMPGYKNLIYLDASDNQIADLLPLNYVNPQTLTSLYLGNNLITDLTPLLQFYDLEVLWLSGNSNIDAKQLETVINGNRYSLRKLGVGDIQLNGYPFQLNMITVLDISNTGLDFVMPHSTLVYLDVSDNQISDLSLFNSFNFPRLKELNLANNLITDITPLLSLWELQTVDLRDNTYIPCQQLDSLEMKVNIVSVLRPSVCSIGYAPTLELYDPVAGGEYMEWTPVVLSAWAYDQEDGDLSGSINWSSDLQGALGSGNMLSVNLVGGEHVITASVTDRATNLVTESVLIVVVKNAKPTIYANGSGEAITISASEVLNLAVSLNSFSDAGAMADWFVTAETPYGWYTYYVSDNVWGLGQGVSYQGGLFDISQHVVLSDTLPPGQYTFYFSVDLNPDGNNDNFSLASSVVVTITP